MISGRKN